MKRILVCLLACMMTLSVFSFTLAEGQNETPLKDLEGQTLTFSSGVGAWFTSLTFGPDGAFSGQFHDGEMGETGETYPEGTVYDCLFHGKLTDPEEVNVGMWKMKITGLTLDEGQALEVIDDGLRFVLAEPYGLRDGQEVILYLPGTHFDFLPEDFKMWAHLDELDVHLDVIPFYGLWNEAEGSVFVGEIPEKERAEQMGVANPWKNVTAGELLEMTGSSFGLPEGASQVSYYVMNGDVLSECRFELNGLEYTARIADASVFTDISGMYYIWTGKEAFNLGNCVGTCWQSSGEDESVQLCLWFDDLPGLMYSLSVRGTGAEQVDLKAIAKDVYIPTQTEEL